MSRGSLDLINQVSETLTPDHADKQDFEFAGHICSSVGLNANLGILTWSLSQNQHANAYPVICIACLPCWISKSTLWQNEPKTQVTQAKTPVKSSTRIIPLLPSMIVFLYVGKRGESKIREYLVDSPLSLAAKANWEWLTTVTYSNRICWLQCAWWQGSTNVFMFH